MRIRSLIILLVIALLLSEVVSQKGSRSSRIKSSSIQSDSGTKQSSGGSIWGTFIGVILSICAFIFGTTRDDKLRKFFNEFEQAKKSISSLSQYQRNQSVERFKSTPWNIEFKVGKQEKVNTWDLSVKTITKRVDFVYDFKGVGTNEQNGPSKVKGVLVFTQKGLCICFDKLFVDRKKAGQTGKLDFLIYEGEYVNGTFEGDWYYKGFEKDIDFSGKMKIVSK